MIGINFLTDELKNTYFIKDVINIGVKLLFAIIVVSFFVISYFNNIIEAKGKSINGVNNEIKKYEESILDLRKRKSQIPELSEKITKLENLLNSEQKKFNQILKIIQVSTPSNMWYETISMEKNNFILRGKTKSKKSNSGISIVTLAKDLKKYTGFKDVNIDYIKNIDSKNYEKEFRVLILLE